MINRHRLGLIVSLVVAMGVACSSENEQTSEIPKEVAAQSVRVVYYAIPG